MHFMSSELEYSHTIYGMRHAVYAQCTSIVTCRYGHWHILRGRLKVQTNWNRSADLNDNILAHSRISFVT